jgi:hypothetical protein
VTPVECTEACCTNVGAVGTDGVTEFDALEGWPGPTALLAVTVNV